jgi:triacylglycerol lipase
MPRHSSLARLQQVFILVLLAAALTWFTAYWPQQPIRAAIGALLIASSYALVLGLEFMLLRTATPPGAQPPRAVELLRAWWAEVVEVPRVFGWRQPFRWNELDDHLSPELHGRRGAVFIHGFICNRGFWTPWLQDLRARGHAHVAVNLEPVFGSIDEYPATIDDAVRRVTEATGLPPVLICHSMGGLAARAWLRRPGATARAHRVITIGSPHHGTWLARFSWRTNGRQMQLQSDWLRQLAADEASRPAVPFTCWYSNCDNIVFPVTSATLPGADNRLLRGAAHVDLAFHPEVRQSGLDALAS